MVFIPWWKFVLILEHLYVMDTINIFIKCYLAINVVIIVFNILNKNELHKLVNVL